MSLLSSSEFLTGFRKRNLLKKEAAKTRAKEREHQERLQARRDQRQALQEQARANAELVENAYRNGALQILPHRCHGDGTVNLCYCAAVGGDGSEDEFTGFASADKGKARAIEEAYEDEEQLATVTVVEEFDPEEFRHPDTARGPSSRLTGEDTGKPARATGRGDGVKFQSQNSNTPGAGPSTGVRPSDKKTKTRPKKIAYETKAARKASRVKQRSRRTEKAEAAGGKSSRRGRGKPTRGGRKGK